MKKIDVVDRAQIKQILRARGVLAIADKQYQRSGVLQLWWQNIEDGVCNRCESRWSDTRIKRVNLNEALDALWRNRSFLYLRGKHLSNGHRRITYSLKS